MENLQLLLDKSWKIKISNGRTFTGICKGIDKDKNVILTNAEEYFNDIKRQVGMIMIPGTHIKEVFAMK